MSFFKKNVVFKKFYLHLISRGIKIEYQMAILLDEVTKIGLSLLLGSLLGLEREYQNKPAGFRTIALICVGATLFTILSYRLGNSVSVDRVAANIITGIGFIGAGVIFKNNNTVYGLTTASTIWLAAGLGMTVGVGAYILSVVVLLIALIVLSFFETLQNKIDSFHERRVYVLTYEKADFDKLLEQEMKKHQIKHKKIKAARAQKEITCEYVIFGKDKNLHKFNDFLMTCEHIRSFTY